MACLHHSSPAKLRTGTSLIASALAIALTAAPVIAASPDLAALGNATPLADEELAEMRGKFVTPQSVSFFGITMLTSWQDSSGVTTLARLLFSVDFLPRANGGAPVPQLMIAWSRDGAQGVDPGMDAADMHAAYVPYIAPQDVSGVGGLGSFAGAAQANVIAGADNRTLNAMQVMIMPSTAVAALTQGGLNAADGPVDIAFPDGDVIQFRAAGNQLGIIMAGNGRMDSTSQLVGGDIGQLLQQTILTSDNNMIENRASVIFGVDGLQGQQTVRLQEALSAMKGHGY
ncbi:MAG: hypothetical protein ACJLS3_13635 [Erythrobacter sp.]